MCSRSDRSDSFAGRSRSTWPIGGSVTWDWKIRSPITLPSLGLATSASESGIFRRMFERVVGTCIDAGLVGGEAFAVDASLIEADANRQRSIAGKEWSKEIDPAAASRSVKEYLATLNDAAFGAATEVEPKFVSPSDPAAHWTGALKGPAFFAYADNYLIDVRFAHLKRILRLGPIASERATWCPRRVRTGGYCAEPETLSQAGCGCTALGRCRRCASLVLGTRARGGRRTKQSFILITSPRSRPDHPRLLQRNRHDSDLRVSNASGTKPHCSESRRRFTLLVRISAQSAQS